MIRPPTSTPRTDTLVPTTTLFRSFRDPRQPAPLERGFSFEEPAMPKFKHIAKGQYHTKIKVLVPGDFDQLDEQEITFTLRRYKVDEGRAILQRFRDSGTVGDDTDVVAGILRESRSEERRVGKAGGGTG